MELFVTILLLALGLLLIVKGGDVFVDTAAWMAEASGIPKLIVGATVVSFATTLPELVVSTLASLEGKADMALGNAVGSVTANLGLIMGLALTVAPAALRRKDYLIKTLLMLGASLYLVIVCKSGRLSLAAAGGLLVLFALAMWDNLHHARQAMRLDREAGVREDRPRPTPGETGLNVLKFLLGTAAIVAGARLLVDNGSVLARVLGVPERIIGVTLIAVGTSLPELVTTLSALAKGQGAISAGNIIGANILNMTLILPVCTLVSGGALSVSPQAEYFDIPAALAVGCVAMLPALAARRFQRWQGVLLLVLYAAYLLVTSTAA